MEACITVLISQSLGDLLHNAIEVHIAGLMCVVSDKSKDNISVQQTLHYFIAFIELPQAISTNEAKLNAL